MLIPVERSGPNRDSKAQPQFIRHVNVSRVQKELSHLAEDLMTQLERRLKEHVGMG